MRSRRRIALLLASAGALGVGLIAFPSSAAALPPVVPTCVFPNTPGSDSCGKVVLTGLQAGANQGTVPAFGTAYENAKLGIRVRSQFNPATSKTTNVQLQFDDHLKLNMASVPGTCTAAQLSGDTIAQAYAQCGPGPGGSNTYLSQAGNVSGVAHTTVAGLDACTMIFQGATDNQLLIYARAAIGDPPSECNSPATNSTGSTTVIFTAPLTRNQLAGYDWKLTVPNTHTASPALNDFSATVTRGVAFQARCPAPSFIHKMWGRWQYTASGDFPDFPGATGGNNTPVATDPCP